MLNEPNADDLVGKDAAEDAVVILIVVDLVSEREHLLAWAATRHLVRSLTLYFCLLDKLLI